MAEVEKPDLCIVGGGAEAWAAVEAARALGASVILVAPPALGGIAPFDPDLAATALVEAAHGARAVQRAGGEPPEPDVAAIGKRIRALLAEAALAYAPARFEALGARVLLDPARFLDARTLEAGGTPIRARRFLIASGARPSLPEIPGLDRVPHLTAETVFELAEKPDHLVVLGGGRTGLELAQACHGLGIKVTIIERGLPLEREDPELAGIVLQSLAAQGLEILSGTGIVSLARHEGGIRIEIKTGAEEREIAASHLLVAAGSRPRLEGLEPERAGIAHGPEGIVVNARGRTGNRRVYAAGTVARWRPVPGGGRQGRAAALDALAGLPLGGRASPPARVTRTVPEIAHVGLTEPQARRQRKARFAVVRWPHAQNARALAMGRPEGLVKLVLDPRGRILGASIVGPEAGEAIALYALAVAKRLTVRDLAALSPAHPSLAESAVRAALAAPGGDAQNPWHRRLFDLNRLLP